MYVCVVHNIIGEHVNIEINKDIAQGCASAESMSEVYSARTRRYDDTASMYSMDSIVVRRQCT